MLKNEALSVITRVRALTTQLLFKKALNVYILPVSISDRLHNADAYARFQVQGGMPALICYVSDVPLDSARDLSVEEIAVHEVCHMAQYWGFRKAETFNALYQRAYIVSAFVPASMQLLRDACARFPDDPREADAIFMTALICHCGCPVEMLISLC